jgi:hypothetical protein
MQETTADLQGRSNEGRFLHAFNQRKVESISDSFNEGLTQFIEALLNSQMLRNYPTEFLTSKQGIDTFKQHCRLTMAQILNRRNLNNSSPRAYSTIWVLNEHVPFLFFLCRAAESSRTL